MVARKIKTSDQVQQRERYCSCFSPVILSKQRHHGISIGAQRCCRRRISCHILDPNASRRKCKAIWYSAWIAKMFAHSHLRDIIMQALHSTSGEEVVGGFEASLVIVDKDPRSGYAALTSSLSIANRSLWCICMVLG